MTVQIPIDGERQGPMEPGDLRIVRGAVLATAAVGAIVVVVAALVAGTSGVWGALAGTGLAIAFFAITIVAVSAAARVANELMLPVALGTYLVKIVGIALALFLLRDTTAFDRPTFAIATVIGAVVFMIAEMRIAVRSRTPYVTTPDSERTPGSTRSSRTG